MGCICPSRRSSSNEDEGSTEYVEYSNYIGEKNCCGQKSGRGQYYYDNGDMYDGMWKRNKKHGYGVYTYKSGKCLDGFFENDRFLGTIMPEHLLYEDEDADEPLPKNADDPASWRNDQTPELSEELLHKKEEREKQKREHEKRIEKMKKKYGIPSK
eukprot:gene4868-5507_t